MNKLCVVGIGPGNYENMTIRADRALREAEVIIGYTLYVELIRSCYPEKEYISTPMTKEAQRCQIALDSAKSGRKTALVCSGDSGVYGMAALLYELRGERSEPELEIIPGVTAACSGAALLGAPLTQDFAAVSLSDRLTGWDRIEAKLEAAAQAELSVVLYNPASKSRPEHLRQACEILLRHLPEDTVCGVAQNVGREGEAARLTTLGRLKEDKQVDMFSTVFIGTRQTFALAGRMITPRGYRDV